MKIRAIEPVRTAVNVAVTDTFAGDGYVQGPGGSLPDVDSDFQSDRRQEVKEYLEQRYNTEGRRQVFSAGTLTTLKMKAVLKDVCRVYRVPIGVANYITAIFEDDNMSWTDLFRLAATNKKVRDFIQRYPQVIEDMRPLMGQPRSASVHASAIIITPKEQDGEAMECFDYTPIRKTDELLISELDGYSIDEVGLLKNDCLGIKELSKIQAVLDICNREYEAGLTFEGLVRSRLDDEKTYRLLSEGYTQNVFQFASRGMTRFLQDMQPERINDLIAANALYRPATLESGSAEKFLLCRRDEVAPVYLWGTYEALKNTYGVLVFQEQLAQMAREVGAFSLAEGVRLLKLISKKKVSEIHALKEKFMSGASQKGCPREDATRIWEMIEAGGGYLFNASHATAYAVTSYVGAYLKANYPTAFYTVALQWADDKEIPLLMSEMELCSNARIVPPEINTSRQEFFTDYRTDEIFWSLSRIKQLGAKAVAYIVEERTKNGPYESVEHFIHRIFKYKLKKYAYWDDPDDTEEAVRVPVNARHVRNMILAGCFDKVAGIGAVDGRYGLLETAARELGFSLSEQDFPSEKVGKHYFWSQQQVNVSGIGSIDYRRIFEGSEHRAAFKGKASYLSLREVFDPESDGRRAAVCATVADLAEASYKDKTTGERKKFVKLTLQQNNDVVELVCWNDFYTAHNSEIPTLKDRIVIASAMVRYSDYNGSNSLQSYKSSLLFIV
jgi:DNA polymerase-3 subunit alpha|nr:MAG TPA: DNA polymerase III, alpha subunit [Bacteriophage sp.]